MKYQIRDRGIKQMRRPDRPSRVEVAGLAPDLARNSSGTLFLGSKGKGPREEIDPAVTDQRMIGCPVRPFALAPCAILRGRIRIRRKLKTLELGS